MIIRRLVLLPFVALAAGPAWSADDGTTLDKIYQIMLTGDHGARFVGQCTLETANGLIIIPLDGNVPHQQAMHGASLSCALRAEGQVIVDIQQDGNRSRTATNGGTININVH